MASRKIIEIASFRNRPLTTYRPNSGIAPGRADFIRSQARDLLIRTWKTYRQLNGTHIDADQMLPLEPRFTAIHVLGWQFEEPEEIVMSDHLGIGREIAGVMNRTARTVSIARKFPVSVRRFTGAHELAHLQMHPNLLSLRESPFTDDELRRPASQMEREANLFAAAFLMPARLMRKFFSRRYGQEKIKITEIDDDIAFYFAHGHSASALRQMEPVEVAKIFAAATSFIAAKDRSLTEVFGVTATAMAFQWLDLGLLVR